jgi:condensin complex subunit 2
MSRPPSAATTGSRRQSVNPFAAVLHNSPDDETPHFDNMSIVESSVQKEVGNNDDDDDNSQVSNSSSVENHRVRPPRPSMAVVATSKSIGAMNQRRRRRSSARFLHLTGDTTNSEENEEELPHDDDRVASEKHGTLQEMYQTAIRMNAENKINTTNTWNLHIIDQMDTLLSLNDEAENEDASEQSISASNGRAAPKNSKPRVNFTKASCTLDASVKIYSYRVDDVHLTSYKVLANLNRTQNNKKDDPLRSTQNNQDPANDDDEGGNGKTPHSSKSSTGNTLETNMGMYFVTALSP